MFFVLVGTMQEFLSREIIRVMIPIKQPVSISIFTVLLKDIHATSTKKQPYYIKQREQWRRKRRPI